MAQIIRNALFNSTAKNAQLKFHAEIKESIKRLSSGFPKREFDDYLMNTSKRIEMQFGPKANQVFFKPFQDRYDFFSRAVSIPLASVGLILETVEDLLTSIVTLGYSLLRLVCCDFQGAKNEFETSVEFFVTALEKAVTALLSPIINLVDLIGGSVQTAVDAVSHASAKR